MLLRERERERDFAFVSIYTLQVCVSGGEERHQFFLKEKIAKTNAREEEEEEQQRNRKHQHQLWAATTEEGRKDSDDETDAVKEKQRDLNKRTYYSGFIFIYARVCFYSFKVKRPARGGTFSPLFFACESRLSSLLQKYKEKGSTRRKETREYLEFFVKNSSLSEQHQNESNHIIVIVIFINITHIARWRRKKKKKKTKNLRRRK